MKSTQEDKKKSKNFFPHLVHCAKKILAGEVNFSKVVLFSTPAEQ